MKKIPQYGSYQYSAMADDIGLGTNVRNSHQCLLLIMIKSSGCVITITQSSRPGLTYVFASQCVFGAHSRPTIGEDAQAIH